MKMNLVQTMQSYKNKSRSTGLFLYEKKKLKTV